MLVVRTGLDIKNKNIMSGKTFLRGLRTGLVVESPAVFPNTRALLIEPRHEISNFVVCMCDQEMLRSVCAYAQNDQSICLSLEYFMDRTSFVVSKLKKEAVQSHVSVQLYQRKHDYFISF